VFVLGIGLVVEFEETVVLETGYIVPDYLSSDHTVHSDFECSFAQAENRLIEGEE